MTIDHAEDNDDDCQAEEDDDDDDGDDDDYGEQTKQLHGVNKEKRLSRNPSINTR